MKIRQRLALRFMLVSGLVTGLILIFIFIVTRGFVHADFANRLNQQSNLEVLHYAAPDARDIMPSESFSLIDPEVSIYSEQGTLLYSRGSYTIPSVWLSSLKTNNTFNTEKNGYTTVGKKHFVNGVLYLVFISDKDLPGQRELNYLFNAIIVGWIISLIFSYYTGLYFSAKAFQPVNHVVKEVNQISEDNLSHRLKLDKDLTKLDEIDELIKTFNDLLNRIEKAFIAQKRFVQNASHELKTPLTAILAEVELALTKDRSVEEYRRTLEVVMLETERLAETTQGLLTLTRLEESASDAEMDTIHVAEFFNNTISIFSSLHPEREIVKHIELQSGFIQGNAQLLQTALLNVLDNAYKYSEAEIIAKLSRSNNILKIGVIDRGIGIPVSDQDKIRAPLVRASNVSSISGAGLGLTLVERILKVHHGYLEIISEEGKGTQCTLHVPMDI